MKGRAWFGRVAAIVLTGAIMFGVEPGAVAADPSSPAEKDYIFGIFPYLPPLTLDRVFAPIIANLETGLGMPVHLRSTTSFTGFAEELGQDRYDLIFAHPFFYILAADQHGYVPLVRLATPLTAVILARDSDSADSIAALKGRVLALPPELSAVSEVAQRELAAAGLIPGVDIQLRHHQSKSSCLHALGVGAVDACALPRFVLKQLPADQMALLKVIHETKPIPNVVIAAHPRLSAAERAKLSQTILAWPDTAEGRQILADAGWERFVAADDRDYDELRQWGPAPALNSRQSAAE
ncbi:MAG: phosphate/phosphite/phosphonate ABC transporter substrate-binding protein [Defluviicoccus sp.]